MNAQILLKDRELAATLPLSSQKRRQNLGAIKTGFLAGILTVLLATSPSPIKAQEALPPIQSVTVAEVQTNQLTYQILACTRGGEAAWMQLQTVDSNGHSQILVADEILLRGGPFKVFKTLPQKVQEELLQKYEASGLEKRPAPQPLEIQ